MLLIKKLIRTR